MNAPEMLLLPDTQALPDLRRMPIQKVGVKGLRYPVAIRGRDGDAQPTTATFTMTVGLPHDVKGTHMSRFVEILERPRPAFDLAGFRAMLDAMLERLEADEGAIDVLTAVDAYVPELAGSGYRGATVQDVLDMRSGVRFSETYLDPAAEVRLLEQVIGWAPRTAPDLPTSMYEYLATLTAGRAHGAAFEYRSCETDILGWVCERATGTRLPDLLSARIWSRLGCEQDMDAAVDPAGAVFADGGLSATLRDLGRFGQMLLDGGVAQGRPVVPAWFLADSYAAAPDTREVFAASGNGSWLPGGGYRNQFWLPGGREVLLCLGIHGQMIWVEPARELVVVKLSSWPLPQEPALLLDTLAAIDMIGFQLTLAAGLV